MKRIWAITAALAIVLAACGSDEADTTTTEATSATTAAPATTEAPSGDAVIAVASSDLGDILVDGAGNTLYLFIPDDQGDSTCYDACANNWPPLTGAVSAGDGVEAGNIGSTTRTDGSEQATYNGWPLYYFAADAAAGDTNGQGLNDVWYVLSPEGEPIS